MKKLVLGTVIAIFIGSFTLGFFTGVFDLDTLRSNESALRHAFDAHPTGSAMTLAAALVVFVSFSIPGVLPCMLIAGYVFKLPMAVALIVASRAIGSAFSFLLGRYLARDWVRNRFGPAIEKLDGGVAKDGWLYLLVLRLTPVLPDSLINPGMGLTAIRFQTFLVVSVVGMVPWAILYAAAGRQLSTLSSDNVLPTHWILLLGGFACLLLVVKAAMSGNEGELVAGRDER